MNRWTTTSIASRFLADVLQDAGIDVDGLLAPSGLDRVALSAPDTALPLATFRELWARAAAIDSAIGITLVERFPPGQMHVLAHLAMRSATVGAAIADCCRYAGVTSPMDEVRLELTGDLARFSYTCHAPGPANPWMAEHYLSMTTLFFERGAGRPLPLRRARFAAAMQAPAAEYRRRFGLDPQFESDSNLLEFDAAALAWPLLTHDAYLHGILERVAEARNAAAVDPLLEQVRGGIARALLRGETPAMAAVAASCGSGERALRAQLAKQATTFRDVLDEVRRDLARDHLARGLSVTETAYLLGFTEPAALQHACRRWFGRAAGEMRRDPANQATAGSSGATPATSASK